MRRLVDGDTVTLGSQVWTLELPVGEVNQLPVTATLEETTAVRFFVNRTGEHVNVSFRTGRKSLSLGDRSHHYVLVLLAEERLADQRVGVADSAEHGWLETKTLATKLGTTSEQVNVWIWRIRQQLAKYDIHLSQRIVERRRTAGELRIGFDELVIENA
ncbi:MAG TPA: hypothetical protein VG937_08010 [Polyangiaceae bacterium]|nr:hypothetical protein [Polyangiaceae bacterium]